MSHKQIFDELKFNVFVYLSGKTSTEKLFYMKKKRFIDSVVKMIRNIKSWEFDSKKSISYLSGKFFCIKF